QQCIAVVSINDPTPTDAYTLSLHDALPISNPPGKDEEVVPDFRWKSEVEWCGKYKSPVKIPAQTEEADEAAQDVHRSLVPQGRLDRKSTRLNSSHVKISYAVFCLKKKRNTM